MFEGKNRRSVVKNPAEDKEAIETVSVYIKSRYKIVAHAHAYFFYFLFTIERTTLLF